MTTDRFDPQTAENPFERRPPTLPEKATERERELAERYTRISFIIVPDGDAVVEDATIAWLVIDQQSWRITPKYCDDRTAASWHCWMLAVSLARLIDAEQEPSG